MNKKLFSAALFGALLLGTASTFVSCKDYDDDIAGLQTQINDVKAAVSALESKVNAGKFVTGVNSTADGITISLSDGTSYNITNGKDGKDGINGINGIDGKDGANGTIWTISEEGYWVCNGETTNVLAVGQNGKDGKDGVNGLDGAPGKDGKDGVDGKDGKDGVNGLDGAPGKDGKDGVDGKDGKDGVDGKDGIPGVKKENGKWYLWNAETEDFEEFVCESAPAATNIPYYFVDPTDPNYAWLVVYDKDGANPQNFQMEIKLPLNEGLGQLTILGTPNFNIFYGMATSTSDEWDGDKTIPSKGDYIVGASGANEKFTVSVTPVSYDLSGKVLKVVNSQGTELPIKLGEAVAYTEILRSASSTGVYEIPVKSITVNDETVEAFSGAMQYSLVANDKVYSGFNPAYKFNLNAVTAATSAVQFGQTVNGAIVSTVNAKANEAVTIENDNPGALYDSYIVMAANAKADSVRYGVKIDGMTVTANESAKGKTINLLVKYYTVDGKAYTKTTGAKAGQAITLNIAGDPAAEPEVIGEIANVPHTANLDYQFFMANLAPYFESMPENRLVWNADFGQFALRDYDVTGITNANVKWEFDSPETGKSETVYLKGLVSTVSPRKANAAAVTANSQITHMAVDFSADYVFTAYNADGTAATKADGTTPLDAEALFEWGGQFTLLVTVEDNTTPTAKEMAVLEIPFTIAAPTDETVEEVATEDALPAFFADGVLTVIDDDVDLTGAKAFNGNTNIDWTTATLPAGLKWKTTGSYDVIELVSGVGKKNTEYTVKVDVNVMGAYYEYSFKVKFVESYDYSFIMGKDLEVICDGNEINIKFGPWAKNPTTGANVIPADIFTNLRFVDFAGKDTAITGISVTECNSKGVAVAAGTEKLDLTGTIWNGDETTNYDPGYWTIKSATGRVANDITTFLKFDVTIAGKTVKPLIVAVTIKASL